MNLQDLKIKEPEDQELIKLTIIKFSQLQAPEVAADPRGGQGVLAPHRPCGSRVERPILRET